MVDGMILEAGVRGWSEHPHPPQNESSSSLVPWDGERVPPVHSIHQLPVSCCLHAYPWPPRQTLVLAIILFPGITTMFAMGRWPSWFELMHTWRSEVVGLWGMQYCVCAIISLTHSHFRGLFVTLVWRDACEAIATNPNTVCYCNRCSCRLTATRYH